MPSSAEPSSARVHIMSIGAHPDDEIWCAGTLAKYARAGHTVTIVAMTRGQMGHMTMPTEELAQVREREFRESASVIRGEPVVLDFMDTAVPHNRESAMALMKVLREYRPDIVLTHPTEGRHPDHRNTGRNVSDAFYLASIPLLKTEHEWHDVRQIYTGSSGEGAHDVFIDVTDTIDIKIEAMSKHKSQYEGWLQEHQAGLDRGGKIDMYAARRRAARLLGAKCGVEYAEAFTPFFPPGPKALDFLPLP